MSNQRSQYRLRQQDKTSAMTEERIRKLNELEFNWQVYEKQGERVPWEERRKQLENYKTAVGDTNVPTNYETNEQLGL